MSIKKEVMKALKDGGIVKVNEVSYLRRWTEDALGNPCDGLALEFSYIIGANVCRTYNINARDYEGIIDEVCEKTNDYFSRCASAAASNLRAGYR